MGRRAGAGRTPAASGGNGRAGALVRAIFRPSACEPNAGGASRQPPESLRPAPCEPPAPGQKRPARLQAALTRTAAPARHAAAGLLLAFAALLALPLQAQAQTLTTLVSNTDLTPNSSSSNFFYAQSFVTGANASGYNISTVKVAFGLTSGTATRVRIRTSNSSNINRPGDLVATLTNPGNLSVGLNTFTAPANTRLDPSTSYWITVNEGIPTRAYTQLTSGDDETGEPGWSIGNGLLKRSLETLDWGSQTHSVLMEINGTLAVATAATGAPEISGTASLGQTLSAGTAGISDANGTTKAEAGDAGYAYAYQWQRVDADGSSNPVDIVGATQSTYTVISADVGSKIRNAGIEGAGELQGRRGLRRGAVNEQRASGRGDGDLRRGVVRHAHSPGHRKQ